MWIAMRVGSVEVGTGSTALGFTSISIVSVCLRHLPVLDVERHLTVQVVQEHAGTGGDAAGWMLNFECISVFALTVIRMIRTNDSVSR